MAKEPEEKQGEYVIALSRGIFILLVSAVLVVGIAAGLTIGIYLQAQPATPTQQGTTQETAPVRVSGVSVDDDPSFGSDDAPVTMVEFSDFQCPFCRSFFESTLPEIKRQYVETGKVRLVYRDFPIRSMHQYAQKAAEAAECASEQDRFWEYHDVLFQRQNEWSTGNATGSFKKYASELGLNSDAFAECLDSGRYEAEVEKDLQDGVKYGVTGTPTFYINGLKVVGARPLDDFVKVIESELGK